MGWGERYLDHPRRRRHRGMRGAVWSLKQGKPLACHWMHFSTESTWRCLPEASAYYTCDLLFSPLIIHECILYQRFYGIKCFYDKNIIQVKIWKESLHYHRHMYLTQSQVIPHLFEVFKAQLTRQIHLNRESSSLNRHWCDYKTITNITFIVYVMPQRYQCLTKTAFQTSWNWLHKGKKVKLKVSVFIQRSFL